MIKVRGTACLQSPRGDATECDTAHDLTHADDVAPTAFQVSTRLHGCAVSPRAHSACLRLTICHLCNNMFKSKVHLI